MATIRASHPAYVAGLILAGFVPAAPGRYALPGATPRAAKSAAHHAFSRAASQKAGEWVETPCECCSHWAPAREAGKVIAVERVGTAWEMIVEGGEHARETLATLVGRAIGSAASVSAYGLTDGRAVVELRPVETCPTCCGSGDVLEHGGTCLACGGRRVV